MIGGGGVFLSWKMKSDKSWKKDDEKSAVCLLTHPGRDVKATQKLTIISEWGAQWATMVWLAFWHSALRDRRRGGLMTGGGGTVKMVSIQALL